ncbi:Os07g0458500 [Oryza sativa Japonica Group]|uniref:Os07g0458500 protein n=1 Tax=Oryza sativa subsp. japonica TaxID=39947 RepID=C7J4N4_ORYSJ|nr:Os07g0458500 [Oryza sativa Japonica Group]|eukprot:NP_001175184.1 Os07g0458500 [Oryza sativa Japonica Group]
MGLLSTAADAAVVLFSLAVAAAAPLIDAQAVLPRRLFPAPLVGLHRWYATEFGDYLAAEPPGFFRGLVWLELLLHWPLSVATLYGVLARRPWAGATALAAGVSVVTAMSAVLGEFLVSGRATHKLLQIHCSSARTGRVVFAGQSNQAIRYLHEGSSTSTMLSLMIAGTPN